MAYWPCAPAPGPALSGPPCPCSRGTLGSPHLCLSVLRIHRPSRMGSPVSVHGARATPGARRSKSARVFYLPSLVVQQRNPAHYQLIIIYDYHFPKNQGGPEGGGAGPPLLPAGITPDSSSRTCFNSPLPR